MSAPPLCLSRHGSGGSCGRRPYPSAGCLLDQANLPARMPREGMNGFAKNLMENTTTEFSFILKPAEFGIGVFAVHNIKEGTHLRLFGNDNISGDRARNKNEVPQSFKIYCIDKGDTLMTPADFGAMSVGWYMNHSKTPNVLNKGYHYYAARNIMAGEEIMIDYNSLEEPEEAKEDYYK